ncbi:MAG: hypothetical protein WC975_12655 [Phycisphaerae bacterium]
MTLLSTILENSTLRNQQIFLGEHGQNLRIEKVDERFIWILDGQTRIGLIDQTRSSLEWIAPHPGLCSIRPAEIPTVYHAPNFQGGRIIPQWWLTCGPGWRRDASMPLPEPFGIFKSGLGQKRPQTTWTFGSEKGGLLSMCACHRFKDDDRIRGEHRITIFYDFRLKSYVADVEAELTAPDPYLAEFCNLYAGGLYDNRPKFKRYQSTLWAHPDGRVIRWHHNPVSYLTPGMNDEHGERRIAANGFLGYFSDPYTNPMVQIVACNHPVAAATCCNLYDEHLICHTPSPMSEGHYSWKVRYRFFSVHPDQAEQITRRSELIHFGVDTHRYDAVLSEPDRTDLVLGDYIVYNPRFPGFYYNKVNDFETAIPYESTEIASLIWASHCPEHEAYWDSSCGHSGHRSIRLRGRPGRLVRTRLAGGPTPHITPKQRYRLSGWTRCQNVVGKGACIRFDEIGMHADPPKADHVAGPVNNSTDWTYIEKVFTTLPDADLGWLYLELEGLGQAWFDDIALEEC